MISNGFSINKRFAFYFNCFTGLSLFCWLLILFPVILRSQQPWQKLSFPSSKEVAALFKKPPSAYSNSVTWGWNGPMSRETISKDLDSLYALGFRVATIEAGYRMPAAYLSDGWFMLVKTAVEEAKKRDMHLWIIDEGKYPSGFAGGKFSQEKPELRMQALVITERISVINGQAVQRKITAPVLSAVAVNLSDNTSKIIDVRSGELNFTASTGHWQILLVKSQFKTSVTRAANNPTGGKDTTNSLCDYLNPVAVKQFITFTHEQYKKYIGDEFGKTVLGFRGDEPDFAYMPWTPALLQIFQQKKGYDVQPYLASFFLKNLSDEQQRVKADYWDVWSDLFAENFFAQQASWCAANNLEYMVHLNHDEAMIGLVKSEGDFFKDFRSVQVPGVDVIWHQLWPGIVADFPKFASSAAHLFGRARAFSECFAAFNPVPDINQARWIVNQQLVRGINLFEFMFFGSASEGKGGARGYMADKQFPALMTYANRAVYLLAQGKPAANIAVYFPTSSLWLGHNESEKSTLDLAKQLSESQLDFDFIDEYSLTSAELQKGALVNKSGQQYKAVIVPSVSTLSKGATDRLKAFVKGGGKVIFTGEMPALIPTKNFLQASYKETFKWATQATASTLLTFLSSLSADVKLDQPFPLLKYLHRQWKDVDMYFFFNESEEEVSRKISLTGKGNAQEWDVANGTIQPIIATRTKLNSVQLPVSFKPYETKFIVVTH